jgi:hypothetical protein
MRDDAVRTPFFHHLRVAKAVIENLLLGAVQYTASAGQNLGNALIKTADIPGHIVFLLHHD